MEKQLAHGAQQFSSLLAHLFPEAPLPLGELLHTDSGLALALGQERSKSFRAHQSRHKVHSRRTSACRKGCSGLTLFGSVLSVPLDRSQESSKVRCCVLFLPLTRAPSGHGGGPFPAGGRAAAQNLGRLCSVKDLCVGLCMMCKMSPLA